MGSFADPTFLILKFVILRGTVFKGGIIPKTAGRKELRCLVKGSCDMGRLMGVRPDRDHIASKLFVAL